MDHGYWSGHCDFGTRCSCGGGGSGDVMVVVIFFFLSLAMLVCLESTHNTS